MSAPGEDQRWRPRRQQNAPGSSQQGQQGQQGQRRNQSRDGNSYAAPGGYQGGNRDGGNAWANRGPPQGQPATLVDEHVPVRGFNSREVSEYLNRAYLAALNEAQNPQKGDEAKPMIFKSPENPWKTTGKVSAGPWSRPHVMANGNDFLSQLRKGVAGLPTDEKK